MEGKRWFETFLVVMLLVFLFGCGMNLPGTITGSGTTETRDFSLSGFTGIQAANAFSVQVNRSDSFSVRITADGNLWDSLDISIAGKALRLRAKPGINIVNATLEAVVTLPSIDSLDFSGASTATLSNFTSNSAISFVMSGGSTANISNMKSGPTVFDISGASTVSVSMDMTSGKFIVSGGGQINLVGTGTNTTIDASGGSRLTLNEFAVETTKVVLSGGSEARVFAQKITSADLSGGSNLYYVGSPTIGNVQTSGGSGIHQETAVKVSGSVIGGGDTTPPGLLDAPRRFVWELRRDNASIIYVSYTVYPPSPTGDIANAKITLNFYSGTINIGDYIVAFGAYDVGTNTVVVANEGDYVTTYASKP